MKWWLMVPALLLIGCGGEAEQRPAEPEPVASAAEEAPSEVPVAPEPPTDGVLSAEELERLERQFAREAKAAINLANAEAEGWRTLQRVNAELAEERAAAGIETPATGGPQ